jgi:hypothetical protein
MTAKNEDFDRFGMVLFASKSYGYEDLRRQA